MFWREMFSLFGITSQDDICCSACSIDVHQFNFFESLVKQKIGGRSCMNKVYIEFHHLYLLLFSQLIIVTYTDEDNTWLTTLILINLYFLVFLYIRCSVKCCLFIYYCFSSYITRACVFQLANRKQTFPNISLFVKKII